MTLSHLILSVKYKKMTELSYFRTNKTNTSSLGELARQNEIVKNI